MLAADPPPPPLPRARSVEGRPLRAQCRGPAAAPRRLLAVAGMHGDEPHAVAVTRVLVARRAPAGVRICVVHRLNPDGLARGTRTNARGVDLNRNFPRRWRPGPRGRFHPGPRAASEPETRFAMALVQAYAPTLTVWLHQPYGFVVDTPTAPRALLRAYARRVRLPLRRLPPYRGTAVAWQRRGAFVVELPAGRSAATVARRHARAAVAAVTDPAAPAAPSPSAG
ncbi:MAG TPA: DUF2817 domain-containing protein [Baekduia sp.]|nr:DUF2817 domain-containing protein [Baekduia sp.]